MTTPKPTFQESLSNGFQVWALKRARWNPIRALTMPFISWKEGIDANKGSYLHRKRLVLGSNFCAAGGVWLGDFESVAEALTEPQARGYRLASSLLDPAHLPMKPDNGREVFLLSLSQEGAGGDGTWEGVREAVNVYLTNNPETYGRQEDATAKKLVDNLAESYKTLGHSDEFFTNGEKGLMDFLLRYLHYVIFGLDPFDEEKMAVIRALHYDSASAAYHLSAVGNFFQLIKFKNWPEQFTAAAEVYMNSPDIAKFPENEEKYANLTRMELARLMVSIMALAGMVGPLTLAVIVLGHRPLNEYEGQETHKIDVTKVWDTLDLSNRVEVAKYMFECGRLRNPVSNSHRIVTKKEKFTVKIRGKDQTFPAGTEVFIPMLLGMIDEKKWGPTTYEFDHNRENVVEDNMIFHSVGDRTNGRICPGKEVAVKMMTDVLIELGKVRRSSSEFQAK
eukprot:CAMPEP_0194044462 /NCGR_PEP_ID=MMETSP0009_2-20130614/15928_1 /TAXON_ID=210454 /ORGANISM="Grammatophora oceanica, Strain CCMP 410" /LENGTH=448 /DNA_ID=CAMNT_0038688991 /DNA_START=49 /DNA_END=1398 /DNA_ORIENTATION=-